VSDELLCRQPESNKPGNMNSRTTLFLFAVFSGLAFWGCMDKAHLKRETQQNVSEVFNLEQVQNLIKEKTIRFTEAHITRDTAYLNNIVTLDARCYPPNSDAIVGRKAISELNEEWVNYGISEFVEKTEIFYGNEMYLIDEGTYYLRYGNDNIIDKGKYINIWTRENNQWKICSNIWNTSLPSRASE
jgi:ketosteroid isomerase-like protein